MNEKTLIKDKSFALAVRIVKLCQYLNDKKKEYVISKQLLRCGTSIGANVREGQNAESRADFIHKLAIAQKEASETIYWLELMEATGYLSKNEFDSINEDAVSVIKILTKILKSTKNSPQPPPNQ
jgi:four helix bundle protein